MSPISKRKKSGSGVAHNLSALSAVVPDGPLRTGVPWDYILSIGTGEARRVRRCRGCKYLGVAGHLAYCSYYLQTGIRRPCKFGQDCPVKEVPAGVEIPESHAEFIRQCDVLDKIDELNAKKQAKREAEQTKKKLTFMRQIQNALNAYDKMQKEYGVTNEPPVAKSKCGVQDEPPVTQQSCQAVKGGDVRAVSNQRTVQPVRPAGRSATWDRDYARMLWQSGEYYVFEIAEIVGTQTNTLWTYITRHGWRDLERGDVKPHRHIIEDERTRYFAYIRERERAGL